MRAIYYYTYLFYKKILKDDDPHLLTFMAISITMGLLVNYSLNTILVVLTCKMIHTKFSMIAVGLATIMFNYLLYIKNGRYKLWCSKPILFWDSSKLTILIVILSYAIPLSFPFWMTEFYWSLIENCS